MFAQTNNRLCRESCVGYTHHYNLVFDRKFLRKILFCILLNQSNTRSKLEIWYMLSYLIYEKHLTHFHTKFVKKLQSLHFLSAAIQIVESFLTGRLQQVSVNGVQSESNELKQGVPQGSHRAVIFHYVCE